MNKNIALVSVSILSAIFFFGWVVPDFPYTRRLTSDKAKQLLEEYKKLYLINWTGIKLNPNKWPILNKEQQDRFNEIKLKLTKAGYIIDVSVNESNGIVDSNLGYPKYAG